MDVAAGGESEPEAADSSSNTPRNTTHQLMVWCGGGAFQLCLLLFCAAVEEQLLTDHCCVNRPRKQAAGVQVLNHVLGVRCQMLLFDHLSLNVFLTMCSAVTALNKNQGNPHNSFLCSFVALKQENALNSERIESDRGQSTLYST